MTPCVGHVWVTLVGRPRGSRGERCRCGAEQPDQQSDHGGVPGHSPLRWGQLLRPTPCRGDWMTEFKSQFPVQIRQPGRTGMMAFASTGPSSAASRLMANGEISEAEAPSLLPPSQGPSALGSRVALPGALALGAPAWCAAAVPGRVPGPFCPGPSCRGGPHAAPLGPFCCLGPSLPAVPTARRQGGAHKTAPKAPRTKAPRHNGPGHGTPEHPPERGKERQRGEGGREGLGEGRTRALRAQAMRGTGELVQMVMTHNCRRPPKGPRGLRQAPGHCSWGKTLPSWIIGPCSR